MSTKPKLLVHADPVVRLDRPSVNAGGWYGSHAKRQPPKTRERLGFAHSSGNTDVAGHYSVYTEQRSLMPAQYWQLYKTAPDVRACVDSIVRRIATWDWAVKPTIDPREKEEYKKAHDVAESVRRFLEVPNASGVTWQETMTALVTNLLVYDAGAMELVRSKSGDLVELAVWLGTEWFPITDEHGHLLRFEQEREGVGQSGAELAPGDLAYFQLFRNTRSNLGLPLLESVINECITTILADEHAMTALDADEIPPGLLVLGGVAGPAAERARADLQSMRGKDHSIRVITSPVPQGIEAKWVELRRSPKDLEMREIVDSMRRTIWRVFGVTPVELGDTDGVPRAAAEVQMDVASSHLITPILELLQARINAQIMPALLGDNVDLVRFAFDRAAPASAKEKLDNAKRAETLLKSGVLTINEVRSEMGYLPVDGGDQPLLYTSVGPLPLTSIAQGGAAEAVAPGQGDAVATTEESEEEEEGEELSRPRPGDFSARAHGAGAGCSCCDPFDSRGWPAGAGWRGELRSRSVSDWLPSDWAKRGRFDGYRTLALEDLADVVARYSMEAAGLYVAAAEEVEATIRAAAGRDGLDVMESVEALRRIDDTLDALVVRWQFATAPFYVEAGKIGKSAADHWTGAETDYDAALAGLNYQRDAMAWLGDARGLVGTLRGKVRDIVNAATARTTRGRADYAEPGMPVDELVDLVDGEFSAQSSRINNWSGKLVPVASESMIAAAATVTVLGRPPAPGAVSVVPDPTGAMATRPVVWYYEWAANSGRNCATCVDEGSAGYRPMSSASVLPGQGTICGARCRCVIVLWTEDEIKGGAAVKLSEL